MAKRVDSSGTKPLDGLCDAYLRRFQMEADADFAEFVTEFMAPIPEGRAASRDPSADARPGAEPRKRVDRRHEARRRRSIREHADVA
jgi:hypothetical protein